MKKVLLLEDDAWLAESLRDSLAGVFSTKIVQLPEKVFAVMTKFWPDIIVADVFLGENNLFVLLNEMVSYDDSRKIPIVILSSVAQRIQLDDVREFGVVALLDKAEITPKILRSELEKIVEKNREK